MENVVVTIEELQEVYSRKKRVENFDEYVEKFAEQLKAIKQPDGSYVLDNQLGQYVWQAALISKTAEEYQKRIAGIKETYHVITNLEQGIPDNQNPQRYIITDEALTEECTLEIPFLQGE